MQRLITMRALQFGLIGLLLTSMVGTASAVPITYDVTVDTASLAGTTGSLDFNFNPGSPTTQNATVEVENLSGGAVSGTPALTGSASGALPGTVTLINSTPFNDYFQDFVYGSQIQFDISLSGPALSAPNGTSTSGSAFTFSMFSDPAGTLPALTSNSEGFAFVVDVNLDGSTTVNNFSSVTSIVAATTGRVPVPEPDGFPLAMAGLALALIGWLRKQPKAQHRP
jgi:hypothetical protein